MCFRYQREYYRSSCFSTRSTGGIVKTDIHHYMDRRIFHHSEFRDLGRLVEEKRKRNLKISLCFPTLNEEKTIGQSVIVSKAELMDRFPLLDEIAVVDSGSEDKTCEIAREFGANIFIASDYLKEEGNYKGKGENLWKALFLLQGDIIVYIDADIRNIHHRFVYGLIGPLIMYPEIKFVKAFYKRPVKKEGIFKPKGGGRVTEILIRPLFSQFFPELTAIIQPLSGEYAGYREILEQIPFPVGYGVETGLLIDIYRQWGLDVIAQTDIEQRVHRNQSTNNLGKMAFGILQTFWNRLAKYKDFGPIVPESFILRQITESDENEQTLGEYRIEEKEREPMISIPAYLEKKKQGFT
ncbi:MAG: glucosyl-3-phosphoglycerate synthase [Spirochaetales bacterium]|nr:glucosyl-3-phosphoglycerate synthase [Spirochaetales bacterium]